MKENNNIEEIFKSTFENFEQPVDANVWSSIQSSIGQGVVATGSGSSLLGSISAKITAAIIGVAAITGSVFLIVHDDQPLEVEIVRTEIKPDVENSSETIATTPISSVEKDETQNPSEPIETEAKQKITELQDNPSTIEKDVKEISQTPPLAVVPSINTPTETEGDQDHAGTTPVQDHDDQVSERSPADLNSQWTFSQEENTEELIVDFSSDNFEDVVYNWDFGDGESSNEQNPTHYYLDEGEFNVILTIEDANGISSKSRMNIDVYLSHIIDIQDIFTPNDDLYNQYFDVSVSCKNVTVSQVIIFNKNNQQVYEYSAEKPKWDGFDQLGNQCEQGYYFYTAQFLNKQGELIPVSGKVYLIR